jgi:hypothetical protein
MIAAGAAVRGTIWLAVLAWVAGEWLRTAKTAGHSRGRAAWTLGAVLALVHVALAFHFHHAWSHAAAEADTGRRTAALLGWSWDGGIFFNYLFVFVWWADVAWWWTSASTFARRPAWLDAGVRGFLWFMFLNGAFVFAHGPMRWLGLAAAAAVAAAWYRGRGEEP